MLRISLPPKKGEVVVESSQACETKHTQAENLQYRELLQALQDDRQLRQKRLRHEQAPAHAAA